MRWAITPTLSFMKRKDSGEGETRDQTIPCSSLSLSGHLTKKEMVLGKWKKHPEQRVGLICTLLREPSGRAIAQDAVQCWQHLCVNIACDACQAREIGTFSCPKMPSWTCVLCWEWGWVQGHSGSVKEAAEIVIHLGWGWVDPQPKSHCSRQVGLSS
jgi:hypothetical protein